MKPRITLITLGVDDLEKALRFYRDGLGLPSQGIVGQEFEHGAVAFFELRPDLRIALWPRDSIAHDTFYGGYAGYFQDPDRHVWEVAWNPQWQIPE
jgi:catechol 2,3-dioxygenase-like lactoylglutathione lyase family enzyme